MRIIRLTINESDTQKDVEIIINCPRIDAQLNRLINQIKQFELTLTGKRNDTTYILSISDLFYFESVDNKTFLYDEKDVYQSDLKLYELEQLVQNTNFIRISKNLIVNTSYIENVRALFNGKFEAILLNGEKVIVN
ncbi:LytTR family DNA-binding domain-containing protein [Sporosarcina sp. CAU 1771]